MFNKFNFTILEKMFIKYTIETFLILAELSSKLYSVCKWRWQNLLFSNKTPPYYDYLLKILN